MGTSGPPHTIAPAGIGTTTSTVGSVEQEAAALVAAISAQDAQIVQLEAEVAELPSLLASLAGHPMLWLLLGREGIDRPGGDWSTLVGQQVVPVAQTSRRLLVSIGIAMLVLGIALGFMLARWW